MQIANQVCKLMSSISLLIEGSFSSFKASMKAWNDERITLLLIDVVRNRYSRSLLLFAEKNLGEFLLYQTHLKERIEKLWHLVHHLN